MKKNLVLFSLLAGVAGLTTAAGSSVTVDPKNPHLPKRPQANAAKPMPGPVRGGIYEVQAQLRAVPAPSVAGAKVVGKIGKQAVVQVDAAPVGVPVVRPGTVVKNRLTGEWGYYSGNLMVLLKSKQQAATLQQRFGLTLVKSGGAEGLMLFKAADNADLKKLKADINASGLAREVRLDLIGKRYTPT